MLVKALNNYSTDYRVVAGLGCGIIWNAIMDCKFYAKVDKLFHTAKRKYYRHQLLIKKVKAEQSVRFIMSKDLDMMIKVFDLNLSSVIIRRRTKQVMRKIRNST